MGAMGWEGGCKMMGVVVMVEWRWGGGVCVCVLGVGGGV